MTSKRLLHETIDLDFQDNSCTFIVHSDACTNLPVRDYFSHIHCWDFKERVLSRANPQVVNLADYELEFIVARNNVFFTKETNVYDLKEKELHTLAVKEGFKKIKFNNRLLRWQQKLCIYCDLIELEIVFIPLEDCFYSPENIKIEYVSDNWS